MRQTKLSKDELIKLYESGLAQTQIAVRLGVHNGTISKWMISYGIRIGQGINRHRKVGPENGLWKGPSASYSAFHKRVQSVRGRPRLCERCQTTTAKKYEWASLSLNYADPFDYQRLCTSCHRFKDGHSVGPKSGMWIGGPTVTSCEQCHITFSRYWQKGKPPRFCSINCCNEWQRDKAHAQKLY